MSDLTAQVYRESTADDPAQPMPRLNSLEIDEDVLEGRQAFSFVPARRGAQRKAATANKDNDKAEEEEEEGEGEDDDDEAEDEDFNDREFYSHGAQRAAGVDVPRSESSRHIRVFKSSRRLAKAASQEASSEPLTLWSAASHAWSFVWDGLSEPLIKGALIGVGACVVHYFLIKRR